jgi:hypothetical protein
MGDMHNWNVSQGKGREGYKSEKLGCKFNENFASHTGASI